MSMPCSALNGPVKSLRLRLREHWGRVDGNDKKLHGRAKGWEVLCSRHQKLTADAVAFTGSAHDWACEMSITEQEEGLVVGAREV